MFLACHRRSLNTKPLRENSREGNRRSGSNVAARSRLTLAPMQQVADAQAGVLANIRAFMVRGFIVAFLNPLHFPTAFSDETSDPGGYRCMARNAWIAELQNQLRKGIPMKKIMATVTLLFASAAFAAPAPSLSGQWTIHSSIAGNDSDQECKFVQAESTLSGTCNINDKDAKISGSVEGNKVTWKYDSDYNGTALTLTYSGAFDESGKLSGTVDVDPFSVTGDFTAAPSKPAGK